jgi:uncharacterized protein YbjT (DUF2867 family)
MNDQKVGEVIDSLLSRSARVRALVRSPESDRARALTDRGVELARVGIGDAASLSAALKGVDAFFFMTTPEGHTLSDIEGETRQGVALVDAAVAAAVPHVVYSSVGGAERDSGVPHFESKRRVEEHLQQSGLRATVVRPVAFIDNFAFMGPSVENGEIVLRMPLPDHIRLQMVAVRDIGQISARSCSGPPRRPAAPSRSPATSAPAARSPPRSASTPGFRHGTKPCPCRSSGTTRMRRRCSAGSRRRPPTRPTSGQ